MKKGFAIIDTETSGFVTEVYDISRVEVIEEIDAVKNCPELSEEKSMLGLPLQVSIIVTDLELNPKITINRFIQQRHIEKGSINVHKLSHEALNNLSAKFPREALESIFMNEQLPSLEDYYLVAHNAPFDSKVIKIWFNQCDLEMPEFNWIDSLEFFRSQRSENGDKSKKKKGNRLEDVVKRSGGTDEIIENLTLDLYKYSSDYHDARWDTSSLLFALYQNKKEFVDWIYKK